MEIFDVGGGEIKEGCEVGDPVREVRKGGGRDGLHGCVIACGVEGYVLW